MKKFSPPEAVSDSHTCGTRGASTEESEQDAVTWFELKELGLVNTGLVRAEFSDGEWLSGLQIT